MRRHVPVEDPTRADLEDDEDIEDTEADGHRREEVTGDDRVRAWFRTNVAHRC